MIFGFNTDIKQEGTVYHVQSEARQNDLLLQTQVFVRGRCIAKQATSYAGKLAAPGFSEEKMHEMLKEQHRSIVETIRAGRVDTLAPGSGIIPPPHARAAAAAQPAPAPEQELLRLQWINSDAIYSGDSIIMKFGVTYAGAQVEGARLVSRLHLSANGPVYSQAVTDANGEAEMKISLEESHLDEAAVLVQVTHGEHSATRKFRLRKNP